MDDYTGFWLEGGFGDGPWAEGDGCGSGYGCGAYAHTRGDGYGGGQFMVLAWDDDDYAEDFRYGDALA